MKEFATTVAIRSSPERVWEILTNAGDYPRWNTTVTRLEGSIAAGSTVKVYSKIDPKRAFPVRVAEFDRPKRMVWRGGAPLPFLFEGERTFSLTPAADGTVEFSMREVFSGILSPLIVKSIPDLNPVFAEFGECLKRAAEA
ncbi:MAG TPA: SRPBCC domain-containing protein [Polyangiaceae bacterium]|nr:SRPBCC domain-containing protein [Polyangiaceae bacterium]